VSIYTHYKNFAHIFQSKLLHGEYIQLIAYYYSKCVNPRTEGMNRMQAKHHRSASTAWSTNQQQQLQLYNHMLFLSMEICGTKRYRWETNG